MLAELVAWGLSCELGGVVGFELEQDVPFADGSRREDLAGLARFLGSCELVGDRWVGLTEGNGADEATVLMEFSELDELVL